MSEPTEPAELVVRLLVTSTPDPDVQTAAMTVHEAALIADGISPFDEHTLLSLRPGAGHPDPDSSPHRHLVLLAASPSGAFVDEQAIGYAHLDVAAPAGPGADVPPAAAELAILPEFRRLGHGRSLLDGLGAIHRETRSGKAALQIWSHGDQPGAHVLASRMGYTIVRSLIQMRRPLVAADLDGAPMPAGITIRPFRPGTDDAAWLALNARAFARHPEQSRITQSDLDARMDASWFDPDGFLIAEQDGVMIGFHWTKVHPKEDDPQGESLGEVYVVGVDPDRHGAGLGTALTLAGLRYLQQHGLHTVLLYVESDNAAALAVYRRLEFEVFGTDVMYRSANGEAPVYS